jgi:O-antigen/teichoic acid export membrane protein
VRPGAGRPHRGEPPAAGEGAVRARPPAGGLGSMATVASGTALVLFGFGATNLLNLAFQVVVARRLPVADVGRYFEATAFTGVALSLCVGGLRAGMVRYVAILPQDQSSSLTRRLVLWDALVAAVLAAALWAAAPWLAAHLFHDRAVARVMRIVVVGVPLGVAGTLWAAAARGRRAFVYHFLADQVSLPMVRLAVLLGGLALGFGLGAAATGYVAGFAASALLGLAGAWRLGILDRRSGPVPRTTLLDAVRFSAYRWAVDFLQVVLLWADTVILGAFYPPGVPGVYAVSSRVVVFLAVGLTALNLVIAPFAARGLDRADRGALSWAFAMAARWGSILTFVPLGLALPLRSQVLRLFGPAFVRGSTPLAILLVGFAFNAACGPTGVLLSMSSLNRLVLVDNLAAVALNVGLNLALIPAWGMDGAAVAWSVSLVAINLLMLVQLRRRLGVAVPSRPQVRTAVALGAALAAGFVLGEVSPALGAAAVAVGMGVAILATREHEEVAFLRSMLRSRTGAGASREGR